MSLANTLLANSLSTRQLLDETNRLRSAMSSAKCTDLQRRRHRARFDVFMAELDRRVETAAFPRK